MKKIIAVILAAFVFSCNNDSDDGTKKQDLLPPTDNNIQAGIDSTRHDTNSYNRMTDHVSDSTSH